MSVLNDWIGSAANWWIPVLVFAVILLIALGVGAINGWKTVLYFFGWNIAILIIGVFATQPIVNHFSGTSMIGKLIDTLGSLVGPVFILAEMLVVNFIAFTLYWIFRKGLKRSIKSNKKVRLSNVVSRSIGSVLAVVTAFPIAILATNAAAITTGENAFTKANDILVKGITFGKYDGAAKDSSDFGVIMSLVSSKDNINNFVDAIKDGLLADAPLPSATPEVKAEYKKHVDFLVTNKAKVTTILNNKTLTQKILPTLLDGGVIPRPEGKIDIDGAINSINSQGNALLTKLGKLSLNKDAEKNIESVLKTNLFDTRQEVDGVVNKMYTAPSKIHDLVEAIMNRLAKK